MEINSHSITTQDRLGPVAYGEAVAVWCRVALLSFGGPAGQIAVMHRILVEEKRWVSESRFLHALNYCMLLPGPEAQQLATYIGWLLHGTRGGLTAGLLFVLPGFLSILALSVIYAYFLDLSFVQGAFLGLKTAILAVVIQAVVRIGAKVLKNMEMFAIAAAAFVCIYALAVPFPLIILGAGLLGLAGGRWLPARFLVIKQHRVEEEAAVGDLHTAARPSIRRAMRIAAIWLAVWWLPVLLLMGSLGPSHVLSQQGTFFSKAAMVTFGGAYSVLGYVAQEAVETHEWLEPGEMLDGLGMAETTPGPLIQVVQFVGFMGAYRFPEPFSPLTAAVLGSVITTWVTFAPCFLWIFLGAPYIEYMRGNKLLTSALSAITAAVVGVILNLAIWFSVHLLFADQYLVAAGPVRMELPVIATIQWLPLLISTFSLIALIHYKVGLLKVLGAAVLAGIVLVMVGG